MFLAVADRLDARPQPHDLPRLTTNTGQRSVRRLDFKVPAEYRHLSQGLLADSRSAPGRRHTCVQLAPGPPRVVTAPPGLVLAVLAAPAARAEPPREPAVHVELHGLRSPRR